MRSDSMSQVLSRFASIGVPSSIPHDFWRPYAVKFVLNSHLHIILSLAYWRGSRTLYPVTMQGGCITDKFSKFVKQQVFSK